MRRITMKFYILAAAVLMGLGLTVYFTCFHHPPAEDILAANAKRHVVARKISSKMMHRQGEDEEDAEYYDQYGDELEDEGPTDDTQAGRQARWDKFIEDHNYVSIGEVFNKCEGSDKVVVGKGILLMDKETGGVKTRTFINVTWDTDVTDGEFFVKSYYNGRELYSNHWDLCTVDEENKDRMVFCPLSGKKQYIKDMKIPSYLPKGHFKNRVWATDQDGEERLCSISEFTI